MLSSSGRPALSVVVGSNGAPGSTAACLRALEHQVEGVEVIVCEPQASDPDLRSRFPFARFVESKGALVPHLWREGIDQTHGDIVALTISSMEPAHDWIATIHAQHERRDVVAGAIDPGPALRSSGWAEYFCRYARDMSPFEPHECADLPGDNATYKRSLLERVRETFDDGFWEPDVHRRLRETGVELWHDSTLLVRQGRSVGFGAFARQRLLHGRAYGRQRGARFGRARNGVGILAAPLVPALLTLRAAREVFTRRRLRARFLLSLPQLLLFNVMWALGEARGHADALRRTV